MKGVSMWLLDQIEEKDKEYYDKIFNEYKKTKNITTRFLMSIKPLFVNNIIIIGLTRK